MALTLWRRKPTVPATNGHDGAIVLAEPANGRRPPATLRPIGASGVVAYNGMLQVDDYDLAWQGTERDQTIRRMMDDPVVGAALLGIEMLVRRVPWMVKPADDSAEAQAAADFLDTCLLEMRGLWPGETMAKVLTFLGWGWAVLETIYRRRDDGRIGWDEWRLIPQRTRFGWRINERGDATHLIQTDPQTWQEIPVPLDRCVVFRYASRDNSPEGTTPLRLAYSAWYAKSRIQMVEGIGIERDLAGLPLMRIPSEDIAGNTPTNQMAEQIVTNIRNDAQAGLVLASEVHPETKAPLQDFTLVTTGGARAIDTDPVIRRYANEIVTVFLANVMRVGQDATGSYALADVQGGLFQQAIGAHLDTIADAINSQAVPRLMALNGMAPALLPRLEHGDVESADLARLGAYIVQLGQAGLLADTAALRVFVHEVAGLPVPVAEEITGDVEETAPTTDKPERELDPDEPTLPATLHEARTFAASDVRIFGSSAHHARWRTFTEATDKHERAVATAVRGLFRRQQDEALARLRTMAATFAEPADDPFDLEFWRAEFRRVIGPLLRRIVDDAGDAALSALPVSFGFDVLDPHVTAFLQARAQRFAEQVNQTTWRALKDALTQGIQAGESIDTLAQRVQGVMGHRIRSSALTIARTEVIGAYAGGAELSWIQSGVVSGKQWLSALDDRTRESHIAAHGQTVPLGANFVVGGATGPGPGQMSSAEESINCRCSLIAVLSEEESE